MAAWLALSIPEGAARGTTEGHGPSGRHLETARAKRTGTVGGKPRGRSGTPKREEGIGKVTLANKGLRPWGVLVLLVPTQALPRAVSRTQLPQATRRPKAQRRQRSGPGTGRVTTNKARERRAASGWATKTGVEDSCAVADRLRKPPARDCRVGPTRVGSRVCGRPSRARGASLNPRPG